MKRIAIELYGLTRSYKDAFDSFFINVLQPLYYLDYSVDIFIHTWSESDSNDITWHNPDGETRGNSIGENQFRDIIEKYRPKNIVVDKPLDIPKDIIVQEKLCNHTRSYNSLVSCFYSRYKVNELRKEYEKENNINYDFVILTRFDISFDKPFDPNFYLEFYQKYCKIPANKNAVFTAIAPFKMCLMAETENIECCTDILIYSTPETVDKITNFYKDLKNGVIGEDFIKEHSYSMESLWRAYWKLKDLEHIKIKYFEGEDFHIVREVKKQEIQNIVSTNKKYKTKLKNSYKQIWQYFKPLFSWFSEIFSIFYYLFKIFFKICMRIKACI